MLERIADQQNKKFRQLFRNFDVLTFNFQYHTANCPFLLPHITYGKDEENFLSTNGVHVEIYPFFS